MCSNCHSTAFHPHQLVRHESKIHSSNLVTLAGRNLYLLRSLAHANQCFKTNCGLKYCAKWKSIMEHSRLCPVKAQGGCSMCKIPLVLVCNHAKSCLDPNCLVPFCKHIKTKGHMDAIKQQEIDSK